MSLECLESETRGPSVFNEGAVPTVNAQAAIEEVIEAFLANQIPAKTTRRGYRRHLLHAFGMMAVERLAELQPVHLMQFRNALVNDGRGNATHAQGIISLRSFLGWCAAMDGHSLRSEQVLHLLKVPKVEVIKPHESLDEKEIVHYLAAAKREGPRDHALALIALGAGLRVSELVHLDIKDIRSDGGGGTVIHVRQGKGSKDRMVPVRKEVSLGVDAYLKASHRTRSDIGPLFLREDNAMGTGDSWRLTTRSATRTIKWIASVAGIKKRLTPHALRHTYAFACYLYSRNIMAVSKLLGHASITTTVRYVSHLDQLDLRKAIPAYLGGVKGPRVLPTAAKR